MSTKSKGTQVEKEVEQILQSEGWKVWIPPNAKFQTNDIFGIGDIFAIQGNQVMLVAVALNRKQTNTVNKIKKTRKFMGAMIHIHYYIKKKTGFEIFSY